DFTLNVPRYRVTHRRKVVNGRCCISCANTSLPRFIDAPTELCFAGWQNRYSRFKSRPSEFADYAFLINNLRKPRSKTLGHYCSEIKAKSATTYERVVDSLEP